MLLIFFICYADGYGLVILIGQDGVQRPPIRFPTSGSLLSFLNCLENGLYPHGQLDPPLFAPRAKGLGLPRLIRSGTGDNSISTSPKKEAYNQDYVFRLVSGMKPEDIGKADGAIEVKCSLLKGKVGEVLLKNRPKVSAWGEGRGGEEHLNVDLLAFALHQRANASSGL